jgi:hypothetical protein
VKKDKPTCGVLYMETMHEFGRGSEAEARAFAAGHVSGQAEKVYLGACGGAMFRPQPENFDWLLDVVSRIASRYGLRVQVLPCETPDDRKKEIWISRNKVGAWLKFPPNSEQWHILRGVTCGIPLDEIDWRFHERPGYGQPCDRVAAPTPGREGTP